MPKNNIYFHLRDRQIQAPSGGLDSLSLSPGDTIYVTNSEKNDGAYTVVSSNDSQIFVNESLNDELKTDAIITKPVQAPSDKDKILKPLPTKEKTKPAPGVPSEPVLPGGEFITAPHALIFPPPPPTPTPGPGEPKEEPEKEPETKKPAPKKPIVAPGLIITRIEYPKWWRELEVKPIDFTGPGSQTVALPRAGHVLYVATIMISVNKETQISLDFGNFGTSGTIFMGGEGQPMAMVIAMGNSPAPCSEGGFAVGATGDPLDPVTVGGFATVYTEEK